MNVKEEVVKYETFMDSKLRPALLKLRESLDSDLKLKLDWVQFQVAVRAIQTCSLPIAKQTDLGAGWVAHTNITEKSHIQVDVGARNFVQMSLDEALAFAQKKVYELDSTCSQMEAECKKMSNDITTIRETISQLIALEQLEG